MMLILHEQGWEKGWGTIIRILGNARAMIERSSVALHQVSDGVSLAAFAVNFDGLSLVEQSEGALAYLSPPRGTAVTPEVISVLDRTVNPQTAKEFVRYVLSDEGQELWGVRQDRRRAYAPTLYIYPIQPSMYQERMADLALPENPIESQFGQRVDLAKSRRQTKAITAFVEAACGANHLLLQRAWEAIIKAGMPTDALAELTAPIFDEDTAYEMGERYAQADPLEAAQLMEEWSAAFKAKYERVLKMLEG
jgi:hypothetical protein